MDDILSCQDPEIHLSETPALLYVYGVSSWQRLEPKSLNLTHSVLVSPVAGSKLSQTRLLFSLGRLVLAALPALATACVSLLPPLQL